MCLHQSSFYSFIASVVSEAAGNGVEGAFVLEVSLQVREWAFPVTVGRGRLGLSVAVDGFPLYTSRASRFRLRVVSAMLTVHRQLLDD